MARNRRARRVVLVAARFNQAVTSELVDGARRVLRRAGVAAEDIGTVWVPGAFELPVAAAAAIAARRPDAVIALGCLIKGETPQYAAIGQAVADGLTQVAVSTRVPVAFGVIIADTFAQARQRAGGRCGHRGEEAAEAALDMMTQLATL
ncbi:MAG: 6,7-dimethyl-8-ribityllumazine synthase [Candidatus Omnitrophica bacterium]|nr:6,7-dimethyl-8-ribityllumazine synthase [Candidatus Omnitrophota bacterium]